MLSGRAGAGCGVLPLQEWDKAGGSEGRSPSRNFPGAAATERGAGRVGPVQVSSPRALPV